MDNLTHSLIGAAFARALPKRFQRPEIYWASVIGNNIPDADFVIRFLPGSDALDYLVHHRGYTHTFLLAPIMGLAAAGLAKRIAKTPEWSRSLIAVGISGCFLHVGADAMNSYGVHPFTPFLDRWFYGDAIYIVEPMIWFALLPFIAYEASSRWASRAWWILALPLLGLVWKWPSFTTGLSAVLTGFFAISAALILIVRRSAPARALCATILLASALGSFFYGGARARALARGAWQSQTEATETWIDTASTPVPGNPFCWNLWLAAKTSDAYRFRSAVVSLAPSLYSVTECDPLPASSTTADLRPTKFVSDTRVRWKSESTLTFSDYESYRAKSPIFRRFLSFARFPFIKPAPDGSAIAGDLRYDREAGLGFSEFEIPAKEAERPGDGPWAPPLQNQAL